MHRGHDHHDHDHGGGSTPGPQHGGVGHNRARERRAAQWQTPHVEGGAQPPEAAEPDIDKVEAAFVDGFMDAPDPTSFLRLARIPFDLVAGDGTTLTLLRVEIDAVTDVGSLTPHVGGSSFRYDPLPSSLVSRRRRLGFVYFDGTGLRRLRYGELRALA